MHGRTDATAVEASGTFTIGDLEVHRLGFGAMRITGRGIWGEPGCGGTKSASVSSGWRSLGSMERPICGSQEIAGERTPDGIRRGDRMRASLWVRTGGVAGEIRRIVVTR